MHADSMPNVQVGPTKDEKNLIEDGTPNLSSYRVYPYRAGSTSFGALGENFKWGLFIIKY